MSQQFNEIELFKRFSLDLDLVMRIFKKIKDKNCSSKSLNKRKQFSIIRDSSDFEYTKTNFNQRVDKKSRTINQNLESRREQSRE